MPLDRQKAGRGAYRDARWQTRAELQALFRGMPVRHLSFASCVFLPSGGLSARLAERLLPSALPFGAMLFAAGGKAPS